MKADYVFKYLLWCVSYLLSFFPKNRKKIVLMSYAGRFYNDSPKAISDKLRDEKGYDLVWLVNDPSKHVDIGVRFVKRRSLRAMFELATAKVWVDNCRKGWWVRKSKQQRYMQTWHGSIALKKIEGDVANLLPSEYVKNAISDSEKADIILSGSKWETELIKRAFWCKHQVAQIGTPRSDYFFSESLMDSGANYVHQYLSIDNSIHLILYAPTFRNNLSFESYDISIPRIVETMHKRYGGKWLVMVRLHPNLVDKCNSFANQDNCIDVTSYPDINHLISACELLITDYSSCMFDGMLAEIPVVLYASDYSFYEDERGTYFTFDELPFPIAYSNEDLSLILSKFDLDAYRKNVVAFCSRIGLSETGNATTKACDIISTWCK